jgi:hypothetical protein
MRYSELYVALDNDYISQDGFKEAYEQASRTPTAIYRFINYLKIYNENK